MKHRKPARLVPIAGPFMTAKPGAGAPLFGGLASVEPKPRRTKRVSQPPRGPDPDQRDMVDASTPSCRLEPGPH